jgi:hypothetical protein
MVLQTNALSGSEPFDVISRVQRGLCGYVSYLAACEMNAAFSEYVLYEPILRILSARGFAVNCEYECPGAVHPARGDRKRLDFYATGKDGLCIALEVKWITSTRAAIASDIEKLTWLHRAQPNTYPLLCIFGKKSLLIKLDLAGNGLQEWGTPQYADLKRTRYGCRIFILKDAINNRNT